MFPKTCRNLRIFLHRYVSFVFLTVILIAACQGGISNSPSLEERLLSTDCRVIDHAGGKTTICDKPQKVAALEPKILSMMLALDVQPAAYADAYLLRSPQFDNPSKQIPYLGNFVTSQPINLGDRHNPSLETLIRLKPDLILGVSSQENKLLSSIAPTVLIDVVTEKNWQDNIQIVAKALNQENNVQQVIDSYKQQFAEVRTQLAPLVNTHPRVLNVICSQSMDYIEIGYGGDAVRLFEAVGFQPVLLNNVEQKPGIRPIVTIETLSQLDADLIVVHTWLDKWKGDSTYNVPLEELKQKWVKNPLLHNSRAWKEGRVYFVDYQMWGSVIGGPIADSLILKQLPTLLLSRAQGNSVKNTENI